jgi:ribosomal protein S12 methylthiotransferase
MPIMKKVALISLGCAKNLVDSEVMLGYFEASGYQITPDPKSADIIIINTCGFIEPARLEAKDSIQKAIKLKKKAKNKIIAVTGCYVERYAETLKNSYPEIDIWIGVKNFHHIIDLLEKRSFTPANNTYLYDHMSPRRFSSPPSWAYVKISEGCSHKCGFCAIPEIKGPYFSRNISSIVLEVQNLVSLGIKEINLISHDSTFFGQDKELKDGLPKLLEELLNIEDLGWIRVLYAYPEEISDRLLEIIQEDKICSYIDAPFQHADRNIIKKMKRGMDSVRALKLIKKIRHKVPDAVLRTSIIVGFPGEGNHEFKNLLSFIKTAKFDHLGVFMYSPEKNTSCYSLGDSVPQKVKAARNQEIMEIQAEISQEHNKKYLGKHLDVIFEGSVQQDPSILVARTRYQAPEVDGSVFIDTEIAENKISSLIQKVEITGYDIYDLYGVFI